MVFDILDAKHWPSSDLIRLGWKIRIGPLGPPAVVQYEFSYEFSTPDVDSLACFSVQKLRRTSYGARAPAERRISGLFFRPEIASNILSRRAPADGRDIFRLKD
jgi:hypothetical protein